MKFACIGPVQPYRGGIANFGMRLSQELARSHECLLINFTRLYPAVLFPGKTQFDESSQALRAEQIQVIDSLNPQTWKRAGQIINDWSADALIFHWWHPFFGPAYRGIASSTSASIPKITVCHNVFPHDQFGVWRGLASFGLSRMTSFVIHSRSQERDLKSIVVTKPFLTLFHPLYDIFPGETMSREDARQALNLPQGDRIILYFGLIRPYKGVDILLDACRSLTDMHDFRCLIVGEIYKGRKDIQTQIHNLPGGMIQLADSFIPQDQVARWFRAADLVVLPYKSATQSGVIPIAYRCNRPVVATDVGGLPDVIDHGKSGFLVEPNDPSALADAIRRYFDELNAPDLTAGIESVSARLGWDEYASRLIQFAESQIAAAHA